MTKVKAEYIWLDGQKPTAQLRSKTKILDKEVWSLSDIPDWGFDGSSTMQAEGSFSDCQLKPVFFVPDPIRGNPHILVMCEVYNSDGTAHASNTRARLREVSEKYKDEQAWFGIEQEYTLFKANGKPLGFPESGFPGPQGPYYCGVGADNIFGRALVEAHLEASIKAGLLISGINAEVMPGQWEFQVGPLEGLAVADQLWVGRWLLHRLAEDYGISVSIYPKPVLGDWNGAGAHVNFSTRSMRADGGLMAIEAACARFSQNHAEHIAVYGADNDKRLTGKHETAHISQFRFGISDRGASIRIPMATAHKKSGYLEDRRPAANMDPYQVCARLIETIAVAN